MVATRGLSLLRAFWAAGLAICAFVIAMNSCCHQAAVAKCRLDSREALMALVWLFASGVAVDQLLVDGGSLPCRPYPAPQRMAPCPCQWVGIQTSNPDSTRIYAHVVVPLFYDGGMAG